MSSQLGTTAPSLPALAGGVVVPGAPSGGEYGATPLPPALPGEAPVAGGGATTPPATAATGDDPKVIAALQHVISIITQLIAARQAEAAAAGVQGGGAVSAPATGSLGGMMGIGSAGMGSVGTASGSAGGMMAIASSSMGSVGTAGGSAGVAGGGGLIGGSGGFNIRVGDTGGMGVIGGGGAVLPSSSYGVGASIVGSAPAAATPAAGAQPAAPAGAAATPTAGVTGGGAAAAPQVDMRRLSGTPQGGGTIETVLRSASTHAGAAKSEGAWTVISDANGAQLQAHVHGAWASHPTRLAEGIQRGFVQVHLHEDGTLHLHDVV